MMYNTYKKILSAIFLLSLLFTLTSTSPLQAADNNVLNTEEDAQTAEPSTKIGTIKERLLRLKDITSQEYVKVYFVPVSIIVLVIGGGIAVFIKIKRERKERLLEKISEEIAPQIKKLRNKFNIKISNIDIESEHPFAGLIYEAEKQYSKTNKLMNTLRAWHKKYKGRDRVLFSEKANNQEKWGDVYYRIEDKMKDCTRNAEILTIFSSILLRSKALLSPAQARAWGIEAAVARIKKGENYKSEVKKLDKKLVRTEDLYFDGPYYYYWEWRK